MLHFCSVSAVAPADTNRAELPVGYEFLIASPRC